VGDLRNDGEWTEGRYRSFITSTLRSGMRRWPPKWKALKSAEVGRIVNKKTGKLAMHYICAGCNVPHPSKDVQVDHIEPVVNPTTGFVSWDVYIDRMFCEKSNLQVLCTTCHRVKTKEEKDESTRVSRDGSKASPADSVKRPVSKPRTSRGSRGSSLAVRKSSEGQREPSKPRKSKKGVG
jgi:5-methylcytosine-specific restriction endonuclease McrA